MFKLFRGSKMNNIDWDEIVSIEELDVRDTIDINLDGDRLFLANGILTHNSAVEAKEINHSHLSGSLGKIFTVDIYFAIVFSDIQRQQGEMAFHLLKTRSSDGVGKFVQVRWNASTLRITDPQIGPTGAPVHKFAITNNEIKGIENDRKSKLMAMFGDVD